MLTVDEEKKDGAFDIVVSVGDETGDFKTKTRVFQLDVQQFSVCM